VGELGKEKAGVVEGWTSPFLGSISCASKGGDVADEG
jgi:hypothetical protein